MVWSCSFPQPTGDLNHVQTATFAFGRRKRLPMNAQHILQVYCRTIYHLVNSADDYKNRKAHMRKKHEEYFICKRDGILDK